VIGEEPKIQNRKSKIENSPTDSALAKNVALSCRMLAKLGQFKETTGHVSARSASGASMLIRGRGKQESGLLFTKPSEVVPADFDGRMLRDKPGLKTPNESCIHGEFYRARPDVGAIVHAHPPSLVLTSMAGIELKPVFGGFDPSAMRLALRPIPIFESSLTLHTKEQVHAMMGVMGNRDICIMRGHGVVVCGKNVEEATIKAIKLDALAQMNLDLARLGKSPTISEADMAIFLNRQRKGDGSVQPVWRYYVEWLKNG
jgi:ribulose-5-phosphate 4-epimerase/fuculose-1-phosphate aldolase